MEKMVTKEWAKANSSDTGFFEFLTSSLVLVIRHVFHYTSKILFAMGDDLSYCLWQCFFDQPFPFYDFHVIPACCFNVSNLMTNLDHCVWWERIELPQMSCN